MLPTLTKEKIFAVRGCKLKSECKLLNLRQDAFNSVAAARAGGAYKYTSSLTSNALWH